MTKPKRFYRQSLLVRPPSRSIPSDCLFVALGSSNKSIGAMLLELCVTELEDTSNSTQSMSSTPHPVVQESSHPYIDDVTLRGTTTHLSV